jgi:hypothetical protein
MQSLWVSSRDYWGVALAGHLDFVVDEVALRQAFSEY